MALLGFAIGGALVALVALGRLWWLLRERVHRRREIAWRHWWVAYCRRLPAILMARWPRNRSIAYLPDRAS